MTEPAVIIAAIAGGAVVLAPTVTGVLNIMANNRNSQIATALAVQQASAATLVATTLATTGATTDKKLNDIHILVNSRLSKALDEIAALRIQVSRLKRTKSAEQAAVNAVTDAKAPVVAPELLPDPEVKV